ncbi:MAG: Holliday junction resolvase RuvX [Deltaproteobacteria bacterium]|nr:Holliday junction resolvase RuvX [Deltaproteobacteria bacterium]
MRIMGIDYGDKRVGIAISDPMNIIATGLATFKNEKGLYKKIETMVKEHNVGTVVVGMPINMDDTCGFRAEITKAFVEKLKKILKGIKITTWDERLSTSFSLRVLSEASVKGKKKKETVDKIAAAFILQGYLDSVK